MPAFKRLSIAAIRMNIVIYICSGLFILFSLALMFAYYRTRQSGLALMSSVYGTTAILALMLMHWWPLVAGFALAWVLRLLGLDPRPDREVQRPGDREIGRS